MNSIYLNFYGVQVQVESEFSEALTLLKKDFSAFTAEPFEKNDFSLEIVNVEPPLKKIPQIVASMQTINSICYDMEGIRYCNYYGDLLVILDTKRNKASLYSQSKSKIHEVSYLLLLSRVGKKMDLMGLHKLHAFSVSYKDLAIVCMMPMKGGKSTLLMQFLKDKRFKIISDDIPLINFKGQILPFPIKIGLNDLPSGLEVFDPEKNFYTMERTHYERKHLLCLEGLPGRVESLDKRFSKILLIEAFRYNSKTSILKYASTWGTSKGLFKHGVIGFGLPMVIEYFWEKGLGDFFLKARIFFQRLFSFTVFLVRARNMKLFLGTNPEEAADVIIQYALENYDKI